MSYGDFILSIPHEYKKMIYRFSLDFILTNGCK